MSTDQSLARSSRRPRRTLKRYAVDQIVDHIMEYYKPSHGAVVLMWKEVMNSLNGTLNDAIPKISRDCGAVRNHWETYGEGVTAALERKRMTVVPVNLEIRKLVKHGTPPDLGTKRTPELYVKCLPLGGKQTMGIVVFPADSQKENDHPLIVAYREYTLKRTTTGLTNAVADTVTAADFGNLTPVACETMLTKTKKSALRAFEDDYPLFKSLEAVAESPQADPEGTVSVLAMQQ